MRRAREEDNEYSDSESSADERPIRARDSLQINPANERRNRRAGATGNSPLSRYWCWTSFLESIEVPYSEATGLLEDDCTYFVCQREIAPDSGRQHFQGYCEFRIKKRRNQVQDLIGDPRAHCELRRGTAAQASDYCKKAASRVPGGVPIELGEISKPATNQFEIVAREILDQGASYASIARSYPTAVLRYDRGLRALISVRDAERKIEYQPVDVKVLCGPTGCGKTRLAYDRAINSYEGKAFTKVFTGGSGDWWDGYQDHALIIIDDFNGGTAIENLLTLLGGYAGNKLWPIKGGFVRLMHKEVIITSNKLPTDWYPFVIDEHKQALARRITKLYNFYTDPNINNID